MFGIRGFFAFCLLQMIFAQFCEKSKFDHKPIFDDHQHFGELTLPTSPVKTLLDCSRECHRNSSCTVFSYNTESSESCILYGNVLYKGTTGKPPSPERRYYFYTTAACPLKQKFTMFRSNNKCIRQLTSVRTYTEGKQSCEKKGGRPIVLEKEADVNAVLDILQKSGLNEDDFIFIGGTREGSSNNFVWADGQPMITDLWNGDEPNNSTGNEDCVAVAILGLFDVDCSREELFLCEIPLGN